MSLTKLTLAALRSGVLIISITGAAIAHDYSDNDHQNVDQAKAMDHSKMDHVKAMDHSEMDHSTMNHDKETEHSEMDHSKMNHGKVTDHSEMDHSAHNAASKSAIKIHMAWSGALPPVATNGAAYLMVHNYGKNDDKIIGASTPVAKQVMFHASETKNGRSTMVHQASIDLKAGSAVTFKPGARHMMLMGLKKPLVAGNSFPLTLMLEKAGPVTVMVKVKPLH